MRQRGVFACRYCTTQVRADAPSAAFHFNELWEATSCAACHREYLRQEWQAGGPWSVPQQVAHQAFSVAPRCRNCGQVIRDAGGRYDVEKLRAERACADCYTPS